MVPLFPSFKQLELIDKDDVIELTKKFEPYSDFNFTSLWSYNTEDDIILSRLHDNFVVRFRDYITNEKFYSFIGTNNILKTIDALQNHAEKEGITNDLKLIPESTIKAHPELTKLFLVKEDPDNYDYILSIPTSKTLSGRKFHQKRSLIQRFHRDYPNHKKVLLDINDEKVKKELTDLFYVWEEKKGRKSDDTEHEAIAIKRLLNNSHFFNLVGIGIYHNDKLVGYLLSEMMHDNYVIGHFIKTDPTYRGIGEIIHHFHAQHTHEKGFTLFNIEQDLGIPGLKHSKQQWNPIYYLKKYTISKK